MYLRICVKLNTNSLIMYNILKRKKRIIYSSTLFHYVFNPLSVKSYYLINTILHNTEHRKKCTQGPTTGCRVLFIRGDSRQDRCSVMSAMLESSKNVESSKADTSKGSKYKRSFVVMENIMFPKKNVIAKTILQFLHVRKSGTI